MVAGNLTQEEIMQRRNKIIDDLAEDKEIAKTLHLLAYKQAQIDNPIKPRIRKGRKKRRRK